MKRIITTTVYLFLLCVFTSASAQSWLKVSAGGEFSVALRSDGTLWAWGSNSNGQLGQGNRDEKGTPVEVGTDKDWADVSAGAFHVVAVKKDGSLWAWGFNGNGELGDGLKAEVDAPEKIGTDNDWANVSTASSSSFAQKKNGTLWGWGSNAYGTVGDGTTVNKRNPVQIGTATDWLKISGGGFHVMAIKKDHSLWGWGLNGHGELGFPSSIISDSLPQQINTDLNWSDIACGFQFSVAIKTDGSLWSWGANGNGQLGLGSTFQYAVPQQVGVDMDWASVAVGSVFAFGIKQGGALWAWGYNTGNLGDGTNTEQDAPEEIGTDLNWSMIAAAKGFVSNITGAVAGLHTLALRTGVKTICAAGINNAGQLGNGLITTAMYFDCSVQAISAVAENISYVRVTITPNPAQHIVTIGAENMVYSHLEICNLLGERIFERNFDHQINWNAGDSHITSGVYIARITGLDINDNPVTHSQQVIIRK
jgi:alpha-tubulin suppressor-like RCC1 family protein